MDIDMTEGESGKVTQRELYDEISALGVKVEAGFAALRAEMRNTYAVSAVCEQRHRGVDSALASLATSTEAARVIAAASIEEARVVAATAIEEARVVAIKPTDAGLVGTAYLAINAHPFSGTVSTSRCRLSSRSSSSSSSSSTPHPRPKDTSPAKCPCPE